MLVIDRMMAVASLLDDDGSLMGLSFLVLSLTSLFLCFGQSLRVSADCFCDCEYFLFV